MSKGGYEQISDSQDMKWLDPTGNYAQAQGALSQYMDPYSFMNAFMGQSGNLANMVSGQNSQLQQGLNAIAGREAQLGGEAALASMPGLRNSGAALAAYGGAYADPFARAQAQLQQNQLQGTLGLWGEALGQYGAGNQNALGAAANLAAQQGAWYTPQYGYQPGFWDYAIPAAGAAAKGAAVIMGAQ